MREWGLSVNLLGLKARLVGAAAFALLVQAAVGQSGPTVSCSAASEPRAVRATGIAELLPDIVVRCVAERIAPLAARADLQVEVLLSLNASVTNRVGFGGDSRASSAVLVVNGNDCAAPSAQGGTYGACGAPLPHVQDPQYARLAGRDALNWPDVSVPFPGAPRADGQGRNPPVSTLRIRGVRANVTQLALSAAASPAGPDVTASVALRATSPVTSKGSRILLGRPVAGLDLSVVADSEDAACTERGGYRSTLRLREGFASAWSEGRIGSSRAAATRILLEFREVPEGIGVLLPASVDCRDPGFDTGPASSPDAAVLGLISGVLPDGGGGSSSSGRGDTTPSVRLALSGGTGWAAYEVDGGAPLQVEDCHVPVEFADPSGQARSFSAKVGAGLAPSSRVFVASEWAPTPRFARPISSRERTLGPASCNTNLTFPFVTNQAGFTTGVVITPEPERAGSQAATGGRPGSCSLHYYGSDADGQPVVLVQKSAVIETGEQLVFTLSAGNQASNLAGVSQFRGYLVAVCANPQVSGYAFLSDGFGGIADLAMGYLAPEVSLGRFGKRQVPSHVPD